MDAQFMVSQDSIAVSWTFFLQSMMSVPPLHVQSKVANLPPKRFHCPSSRARPPAQFSHAGAHWSLGHDLVQLKYPAAIPLHSALELWRGLLWGWWGWDQGLDPQYFWGFTAILRLFDGEMYILNGMERGSLFFWELTLEWQEGRAEGVLKDAQEWVNGWDCHRPAMSLGPK